MVRHHAESIPKMYHALPTAGFQSQTRFLDYLFYIKFDKTSAVRWDRACHTELIFFLRRPDFNRKFAFAEFLDGPNLTNYRGHGGIPKRMQMRKVCQKKMFIEGMAVPNFCFWFGPPCLR